MYKGKNPVKPIGLCELHKEVIYPDKAKRKCIKQFNNKCVHFTQNKEE